MEVVLKWKLEALVILKGGGAELKRPSFKRGRGVVQNTLPCLGGGGGRAKSFGPTIFAICSP